MTEATNPGAREVYGAIHEATILAGRARGVDEEAGVALAIYPEKLSKLTNSDNESQYPAMKGNAVWADADRTDEEISYSILQNCHDLGVEPKAAQRMVERFLENRRKIRS